MKDEGINLHCIRVYTYNPEEKILVEVLAGMEEEGIPWEVVNATKINNNFGYEDLIKMAYEACKKSNMGIGIAINKNRVAVHYIKLKEKNPLILKEVKDYEISVARLIGCNAGRLYKVMPFKDIEDKRNKELVEFIRKSVIEVLERLRAL
ncbi:glycerol dehydratase reactivase beta/small subunit family protein [Clostridium sp. MSJ-11]|uniref:Glycerol dehydratase reactivase beta/small subunit family protein n=1 Tax=Clostridium mobile TaxID=2841512 RepID=A0ABS6EI88_9CLOT|nr:glycerol dehydratase reactivase beta/small subunit family protein [Clostridium mobile]MBU5484753.1 glycerol dehydratase reactivase beta/small subunit family protein [Clostridium mobile]